MDKQERELITLFRLLPPDKQKALLQKLHLLTEKTSGEIYKIAASLAISFLCWHPYLIH